MPNVVITAMGDSTAGNNFTLTCVAENLPDNLVDMPELQWVGTGISSSSMNTLDLTFNPLRTSDGGVFMCQWTFTALGLSFSNQTSFSLAINSKHSMFKHVIICVIVWFDDFEVSMHIPILDSFL